MLVPFELVSFSGQAAGLAGPQLGRAVQTAALNAAEQAFLAT